MHYFPSTLTYISGLKAFYRNLVQSLNWWWLSKMHLKQSLRSLPPNWQGGFGRDRKSDMPWRDSIRALYSNMVISWCHLNGFSQFTSVLNGFAGPNAVARAAEWGEVLEEAAHWLESPPALSNGDSDLKTTERRLSLLPLLFLNSGIAFSYLKKLLHQFPGMNLSHTRGQSALWKGEDTLPP